MFAIGIPAEFDRGHVCDHLTDDKWGDEVYDQCSRSLDSTERAEKREG